MGILSPTFRITSSADSVVYLLVPIIKFVFGNSSRKACLTIRSLFLIAKLLESLQGSYYSDFSRGLCQRLSANQASGGKRVLYASISFRASLSRSNLLRASAILISSSSFRFFSLNSRLLLTSSAWSFVSTIGIRSLISNTTALTALSLKCIATKNYK